MKIIFSKRNVLIIATAIAMIIAIACIAVFLHPENKIAYGVFVGGCDVGGMSREEAKEAILSKGDAVPQNIELYTYGGVSAEIQSNEIAISHNIEETLNEAFSKGRSGNLLKDAAELIRLRFSHEDVGYKYSYDKEKLTGIIYNFGVSVNGEHKDYVLEFGDSTVLVKRGVAGQEKDVSQAAATVEQAMRHGCYKIFVELKRENASMANLRSLYDETYLAPQNATYEIIESRVVLVPEVIGRKIDMEEAASRMNELRRGNDVELKIVPILPEVTLEDLNNKLFNHTLAQYTTAYSQGDRGRSENVALAARKIDGMVLAPGEVFSFNDVVGPRTSAAGFKSAPVFENGETVQGLGGGVCQVSSTLYSAVLYADLEIVSRKNHSLMVAYVPKGQDATVSYGTIDFKFKNSTENPIKILASASSGKMSVSIMGTKPDTQKTVKIVHNVVEERAPKTEEIQDATLDVSTKKVLSSGRIGYTVASSRIVYQGGTEVKNERLGTSVYKMVPARVLIGAKAAEPTPAPVPTPTIMPDATENTAPEIIEDILPEVELGDENN